MESNNVKMLISFFFFFFKATEKQKKEKKGIHTTKSSTIELRGNKVISKHSEFPYMSYIICTLYNTLWTSISYSNKIVASESLNLWYAFEWCLNFWFICSYRSKSNLFKCKRNQPTNQPTNQRTATERKKKKWTHAYKYGRACIKTHKIHSHILQIYWKKDEEKEEEEVDYSEIENR